MGVILKPFWNNFEAICQVELSSRSFHALSCPVASSTVYRARPLVCRVVKAVVSCAALADCFDSCIQTAIYTTLLQLPCRLTEFGRKSFQLSLSWTERFWFQLLCDCCGSDVFAVPNPIPWFKPEVLPPFLPALFSLTEFERHLCFAGRFHSYADRNCFRFAHPASAYPEHPILAHFRPSRSSANYRYGNLESNGLIGIEFDEFRQKLKKFGKMH